MMRFSKLLVLLALCLPAWGAMDVAKGSFTLSTCAATCTQDVTSVGFQPTLYILWATNNTAEGTASNACISIGATAGSGDRFVSHGQNDNASPTSVSAVGGAFILGNNFASGCSGSLRSINHSSFLSNGFQLSYTSTAGTAALVHYLAFGGADLTNVAVINKELTTSTGNIGYTGAGFQADFGIFTFVYASSTNTYNMSVGVATSSSSQWATNLGARTGQNMTANVDAGQYQRTDALILAQSSFSEDVRLDFVSWDSDGFTLNTVNAPVSTSSFNAILFKGGQYQVGSTSKCTTASCTDTNSTSFTPKGVFLAAANKTSGTTVVADAVMSIGGTDGTNEGTTWAGMKDATLNTQADSAFNTTKALSLYTAGTPTLSDEADSTLNSGDFQMTWTTSSATAKQYLWAVFGDAAAPPATSLKDPIPRRGIIPFAR